MIAEQKKQIDILDLVQAAGVETQKRGRLHVAICPFHSEKTPSFTIYPDRVHCFGCGFSQDKIGFVMKFYNLSFQEALKRLGIERGELTPKIRKDIEQRKRRAELVRQFEKWRSNYLAHLGTLINRTERLMKGIKLEDLFWYAPLLHALPIPKNVWIMRI